MKKILLLLTLLATMMSLPAQDKVTVKFTAKDQNGKYCPFTEVEVTNVTRNWTATLHYPDTVLTLTPTGVGEYGATACRLGNAFPNPFTGETRVPLELSEAAEVQLRIVRIDGTEMASRALRLDAGTHHVDVRLASPGLSFLIVTTPKGSQVAKLVNESGSGRNAIEVKAVASRDAKSGSYDATGDFVLGDMMKYVGKTMFESAPVSSAAVTQAQSADATVVLEFPVTIPDAPVTPTWPDGTLPGKFSVSATQQVQFSQGNLQYIGSAATPYWKFADHQWEYFGETTGQNSDAQNVDRDLFGWGTSGYHDPSDSYNVNYLPWSVSSSTVDETNNYYGYGPSLSQDMTGSYANYDWGVYNPISNGGNTAGMWRTLTIEEWIYLLSTRTTASGLHYARAQVDGNDGIIILPDDWDASYYPLAECDNNVANASDNVVSVSDWATMEQHGTVFLPYSGHREGVHCWWNSCSYWSVSQSTYASMCARVIGMSSTAFWFDNTCASTYWGHSVRLVSDITLPITVPTVTTEEITDITETTAIVGGNIIDNGGTNVAERGVCWSTSANPTTADDHHAVSLFGMSFFNVSITGLTANTTYHVRAYATNSAGTGYGEDKTFTTLSEIPVTPTWPDGTLPGYFSVSAGQQVQFSQGNLQYTKSTGEWSFMDHQYDIVIDGVENVGEDYANYDVITLFGWGTSGCNIGNTYYQPWNTDNSSNDLYGPVGEYNLTGTYANADWGVWNPISNGGNVAGMWRTLTKDEWVYVFNTRSTASGIRYAKATVNDIEGMVLLPDDWSNSYYSLNDANLGDAVCESNIISLSDWTNALEAHGAVFLPIAGDRDGTTFSSYGSGSYWSASCYNENIAYDVRFWGSFFNPEYQDNRYAGNSVRLVRFEPTVPTVTTADVTDITQTTATCGGNVIDDGGAEVMERGVCWGIDENLSIDDDHQASGTAGMGAFTVDITGLTPNTTYYVRAYAKNEVDIAYGERKTFTTLEDAPTIPEGALNGLFSIDAEHAVYFSQGNLQYIGSASTPYWKFADHQYDYLGNNGQGSSHSNKDRDLLAWATSGYDCGSSNYQPWDHLATGTYGPGANDLTGDYAECDWGYHNAIANGGNAIHLWRTTTIDEWTYLLTTRQASTLNGVANARYAKAYVNGTKGLLLFPDSYTHPSGVAQPVGINQVEATGWDNNNYTVSDWTLLEQAGCVFLPNAGYSIGGEVSQVNSYGSYWSATHNGSNDAISVDIYGNKIDLDAVAERCFGTSVRPVTVYTTTPPETVINAPVGAINGKFTVNGAGDKVYFSQGNLQYIGSASTPYWKFADSQLDYLGQNGQSSSDPNIDRDLFGFGTSGYNHGAVCYQPWSTSNTYSDYYVYGDYTYNLFDQTGQADWGYNAISNGGNAENLWRTLTREEWNYVFNERSTSSGLRYAKATIDEVKGIILFPDDWNSAVLNPTNANSADANFETQLTVADWTSIYEPQGAVFLPAAGYRDGSVILGYGFYRSSSSGGQYDSRNVFFDNWRCDPSDNNRRERGFSVRLVCPAH